MPLLVMQQLPGTLGAPGLPVPGSHPAELCRALGALGHAMAAGAGRRRRRVCVAAMAPIGRVTPHFENWSPSSATLTGHALLMDAACLLRPVQIMRKDFLRWGA